MANGDDEHALSPWSNGREHEDERPDHLVTTCPRCSNQPITFVGIIDRIDDKAQEPKILEHNAGWSLQATEGLLPMGVASSRMTKMVPEKQQNVLKR